MPRYFISAAIADLADVDFDASDMARLVVIRNCKAGYQVESVFFDFSIDITAPHRANNRIHRELLTKQAVDGFIQNVLRVGRKHREISEQNYSHFLDHLLAKAQHLQSKRGRKIVSTESQNNDKTALP
jgi:hypothetical protein